MEKSARDRRKLSSKQEEFVSHNFIILDVEEGFRNKREIIQQAQGNCQPIDHGWTRGTRLGEKEIIQQAKRNLLKENVRNKA